MAGELDGLDQVIAHRPAAGHQPLPQLVQSLVVVGLDRNDVVGGGVRRGHRGGKRAGLQPYRVIGERAGGVAVLVAAERVR